MCVRVRDSVDLQMADFLRYLRGRNRCDMSLAFHGRAGKEKQVPAVCSPLQLHHKAEQGDNLTPSFIVARL